MIALDPESSVIYSEPNPPISNLCFVEADKNGSNFLIGTMYQFVTYVSHVTIKNFISIRPGKGGRDRDVRIEFL